ncbi:hypothetical protein JTB14_023886 [Gonioctena quinquepunctata]|nr:hypothetical protein JTB14_023886 [Gonioctena quinquepunctata]
MFTREHPGQLPQNPDCALGMPITENDVEIAIHRGKNTAPGPYSINRKTMKQLPNTIYPIIALLMNACLKIAFFRGVEMCEYSHDPQTCVWRFPLNPNETQTILFKHPNNSQKPFLKSDEINLTLLGKRLELQDEICYLGVTFTRTLNWQTDLNKTLTRVRRVSFYSEKSGRTFWKM